MLGFLILLLWPWAILYSFSLATAHGVAPVILATFAPPSLVLVLALTLGR